MDGNVLFLFGMMVYGMMVISVFRLSFFSSFRIPFSLTLCTVQYITLSFFFLPVCMKLSW